MICFYVCAPVALQHKPESYLKHIYWFSYFNSDLPSVRYRADYPLEELHEKHGISYSIVYPSYDRKSILHFLRVYFACLLFRKKDPVIVIQKLYTNGLYAHALKLLVFVRRQNTLYDLDDAEYLEYPPVAINYFMKRCAACSMGSAALVEYAKQFNSNSFFLTSPVIEHDQVKKERSPVFTVGWIGCYGGAHKDALFTQAFPAIKKVNFPIRLVLLGVKKQAHKEELRNFFGENNNIELVIPDNINWHDEVSVYQRIKTFDLGLAPLLDIEMHRAKSAFKLKQYFSCGVPVLGSDIGENGRFLENGVNGFLCRTPEHYQEMILEIKNMKKELYETFSSNACNSAEKFTSKGYCSALMEFYRN